MTKAKILIVEDEILSGMDLQLIFRCWGCAPPSIATTGREAIEKADKEKPDVILMDISIDGNMDGIEVAKKIRSKYEIPIIFMTGYSDEEMIERAKTANPAAILIKPVDNAELKAAVESAVKTLRAP
ncbi:MAG: response regulator [Nitrospirae bacterium]|nr:response regulator [Nitrospirota bacterium]